MNGALFPGHYIIPEYVVQRDQQELSQTLSRLERIRKAAKDVFAYQWHDNDEDAVAALKELENAING